MNMTKATLAQSAGKLSLIALAVIASTCAVADDSAWYLGANIGQSKASIDDARINSSLLGAGFTQVLIADENRDTGYKIYGGYQFNRYLAVEGGYFDLGKFGYRATTVPGGTLTGEIKLRGINLDLVGTLPITEKFSVFGRVGANYAEARDSFAGTGSVHVLDANPNKRETNAKLGLGVQYALTNALSLRAEVERYRINDAIGNRGDIDLASVGLVYRFGAKSPAPVAQPVVYTPVPAPQPVIVAAAPPPPPPPAPVPAPMPTKVTFSADALFDFDKATVKPTGKELLNKLAADLRGVDYDVIAVTGHTDRLGTHAYNLKLSERRAEAVSSYLVGFAGIPAAKITARGVDGADPVTKPGECVGNKATKQLVACLQPDRRVDIDVSGTRSR